MKERLCEHGWYRVGECPVCDLDYQAEWEDDANLRLDEQEESHAS